MYSLRKSQCFCCAHTPHWPSTFTLTITHTHNYYACQMSRLKLKQNMHTSHTYTHTQIFGECTSILSYMPLHLNVQSFSQSSSVQITEIMQQCLVSHVQCCQSNAMHEELGTGFPGSLFLGFSESKAQSFMSTPL